MTGTKTSSRKKVAGALGFVVVAAIVGISVTSAIAADGSRGSVQRGKRTPIAVFSHPQRHVARIAGAGSLNPPPGAILASVVGRNEVFVLHQSPGEDCVMNLHVGAGGGSVCAAAAHVEEEGAVGIFEEAQGATAPGSGATLRVAVLVPNGVGTIQFTRRDGSSYQVPVSNNVAESEGVAIASVSYGLPGGGHRTTNVAATVDRSPRQPGAPGSSRIASQ